MFRVVNMGKAARIPPHLAALVDSAAAAKKARDESLGSSAETKA